MNEEKKLLDNETKARTQQWQKRHTSITAGAVVAGLLISRFVSEAMAGQPGWLRLPVAILVAGLSAAAIAGLLSNAWLKRSTPS